MHILTEKDLVKIGFFQKPHGIAGTLLLIFLPEWEENIENEAFLFVMTDGLPVPWAIEKEGTRVITAESALIDIEGIRDEKSAKKLCGKDVYIERKSAAVTGSPTVQFEWFGYTIRTDDGKTIGKITDGNDYAGNYVFSVEIPGGVCLVPYHPDLVSSIDKDSKILVMNLPDGLTEL
jgi:16S rRNA processing protein RimM